MNVFRGLLILAVALGCGAPGLESQWTQIFGQVKNAPQASRGTRDVVGSHQTISRRGGEMPTGNRTFATVKLYRGSVSGGNIGSYGLFVRPAGASDWSKLTMSNLITYGLAYVQQGACGRYYLAAGDGVHRSTDGGKTWTILTGWTTAEILGVAPDPVDSAVVYAATPFGVFKTGDDGKTWASAMRGFKKWYVQQVIIDSRDRQILYATGEDDLYRSTDSGEHWRPMQTGAGHPLRVLQVPTKPEVLVISGEDHGIRRSTDGGLSWYPARDLQSCSIYALRASADGKELYAGGYNTGLWRSTDEGGSWEQVWKDGKTEAVRAILVDPADSAHLFVGTNGTGIVESRDHGRSWHEGGLAGGQISDIEIYP